jgi:hypothetical protein
MRLPLALAPRRRALLTLGLLSIALGAGAAGRDARADDAGAPPPGAVPAAVSAEVIVLHATNDGTGIDPKIGRMPELGKPPLSSYNSYKLLSRGTLVLAPGRATTTKLPNDGRLMVALKSVQASKKKGDPERYVISESIEEPGGTTFLPLLEVNAKAGETFFVAGQKYKGGVLVIGIKVLP